MRVFVQRVTEAKVVVDNRICGSINKGLMLLVGFTHEDDSKAISYIIDKVIHLRIFDDENGVMNKSVLDINGEILSVSQFTLYADTTKGRRPSYVNALHGDEAILLYEEFNKKLSEYVKVSTGVFGADMKVSLLNDGPVSMMIESRNKND